MIKGISGKINSGKSLFTKVIQYELACLKDPSITSTLLSNWKDDCIELSQISGFENKSFDETSYAQLMAKHCQSEHHEAKLTPEAMLSVLPEIERHMLDPIADASIIPTTLLCQHAKKNVTVAIGGDAADELLCGYPTFYAHKVLGNWP